MFKFNSTIIMCYIVIQRWKIYSIIEKNRQTYSKYKSIFSEWRHMTLSLYWLREQSLIDRDVGVGHIFMGYHSNWKYIMGHDSGIELFYGVSLTFQNFSSNLFYGELLISYEIYFQIPIFRNSRLDDITKMCRDWLIAISSTSLIGLTKTIP